MQPNFVLYWWLFPVLAVGSAAGLALANASGWHVLVVLFTVALLLYFIWKQPTLKAAAALSSVCALGIAWAWGYHQLFSTPLLLNSLAKTDYEGTIEQIFHGKFQDHTIICLSSSSLPFSRIQATLKHTKTSPVLHTGDHLKFSAELMPWGSSISPPLIANFHPHHYTGIGAQAVLTPKDWTVISPNSPRVLSWMYRCRDNITFFLTRHIPGQAGALAAALITGDKAKLSGTTVTNFSTTGLAHLLAISGLHITLVAGMAWVILRRGALLLHPTWASAAPLKAWAALGGMLVSGIYMVISGAAIPAQRAWFMVALAALAVWLNRPILSRYTWSSVGCLVLLMDPSAVCSASANLSFLATLGVIVSAQHQRPLFQKLGGSTLAATFATLPVVLYVFNCFSPYVVLANFLAIPWLSLVIMPLLFGMMLWPLWCFLGLEGVYQSLLTGMIDLLLLWADLLAHWPWAMICIPQPPVAAVLVLTIGVLWWGLIQGAYRRWWIGWAGVAAVIWMIWAPQTWEIDTPQGRVYAYKTPEGTLKINTLDYPHMTQHLLRIAGVTKAELIE